MMKLLLKVKAGKSLIKESYEVTNRLNYIKLKNSYLTMKIKSRLLGLIVVRFRFRKKSDMSIIK